MFDLVIRNGMVVDGTGRPAFPADVAVSDGVIVDVGAATGTSLRTLDADGALVTPGFVDIHTHYDGQASWDTVLAPSSVNGVTSAVMGNCGVGFAPARTDRHDWLIALLEGVEDIPGTALAEGLSWDWVSFPDYLDALDRRRYAMDLGTQVPHAALRAFVLGDRGGDHTSVPSDDEVAEMERQVAEGLAAGALGFTTSRTELHRSRGGANIGTLTASQAELVGIVRALRRTGRGVVQLISDTYLTADDDFARSELNLIRELASTSGRKVSFTVQQSDAAPDRWRHIFAEVAAMQAAGLPVFTQVAPRPIGAILGLGATLSPFVASPTFRAVGKRFPDLAGRVVELARSDVRERILAEHAEAQLEGLATILMRQFDRMYRMGEPVDYEPLPSSSLAAEAARAGRPAAGYAYDVFLESGGQRLIYVPLINYARGNLDDVYGMMTGPHSLYGLSDGGAHCGTICDASFPTTTLGLWHRGNRAGLRTPVETLVHGYTQRNAAHVGWLDRGVVAPGMLADLNVIDLDGLSLSPPEIAHDLPAGAARLVQTPHGYRWTVKNGTVTFAAGAWTGETPGALVRGARPAPA